MRDEAGYSPRGVHLHPVLWLNLDHHVRVVLVLHLIQEGDSYVSSKWPVQLSVVLALQDAGVEGEVRTSRLPVAVCADADGHVVALGAGVKGGAGVLTVALLLGLEVGQFEADGLSPLLQVELLLTLLAIRWASGVLRLL